MNTQSTNDSIKALKASEECIDEILRLLKAFDTKKKKEAALKRRQNQELVLQDT